MFALLGLRRHDAAFPAPACPAGCCCIHPLSASALRFPGTPTAPITKYSFEVFRLCVRFLHAGSGANSRQAESIAAQAGRLSDEGPVRDGDLRGKSARLAQAGQSVFSPLAADGLGP